MSGTAPAPTYRRSGLDLFASCAFAFERVYEQGVVDSGEAAIRGQSFHHIRLLYIQRLVAASVPADHDELQQAMLEGFATFPVAVPIMREVEDILLRWAQRFELDVAAFLAAEDRLQQDEFVWRPDLVYAYDDALQVDDDKTYWSTFDDVDARQDFQAQFYIWRAAKLWPGFPRYRFRFNFVRYGTSAVAEWDASEVDEVEQTVRRIVAGIEHARATQAWPATPGRHCGYCSLKCPVVDNRHRDPVRYLTPAEAAHGLGELIALERAVDARRKALQAYTDEHGPVGVNGVLAGYRDYTERRWAVGDVLRILERHRETPDFSVAKTALSKYLTTKKRAHIGRELEEVCHEKISARFATWSSDAGG